MTTIETMILHVVQSHPNVWLNCSGRYLCAVLALQLKGAVEQRIIDGQLQIKLKGDDK